MRSCLRINCSGNTAALFAVWLIVSTCPAAAESQKTAPDAAAFRAQLEALKAERFSTNDPEQVVARFEQLIYDYRQRPEAAEAMYQLGRYYLSKDLSSEKAIAWLRQAVANSTEDSAVGRNAIFSLAGQLRWTNNPKKVQEARLLTEQLARSSSQNVLDEAKVASELAMQCLAEDNFVGAELHCRQLMNLGQANSSPMHPFESQVLEAKKRRLAEMLMQRMQQGPGTKEGKTTWLNQFEAKYGKQTSFGELLRVTKHHIESSSDPQPPANFASSKSGVSVPKKMFLVLNIMVVALLGWLAFKQRVQRTRAAI